MPFDRKRVEMIVMLIASKLDIMSSEPRVRSENQNYLGGH